VIRSANQREEEVASAVGLIVTNFSGGKSFRAEIFAVHVLGFANGNALDLPAILLR